MSSHETQPSSPADADSGDVLLLRTRPTTVEARRLSVDNRVELARWARGWTYGMTEIRWFDAKSGRVQHAELGQWVVKQANGCIDTVSDSVLFSIYDRMQGN